MARVKPAVALLGVGGIVGLFVLAKRAKAAQQQNPRELPSSSTAPSSSTEPSSPAEPPLLPARTSSAQEGEPLAWDRSEHPLAERDSRDVDATDIRVEPTTWIDAEAEPSGPAAAPAEPPAPEPAPVPAAKPKPKPPAAKPPAPMPPAPSSQEGRTPVQAARELYEHASALLAAGKGAQLGVKGAPSSFVRDAQRDMGGLTADGMYGPATRTRGKQLTGQTFPVRK